MRAKRIFVINNMEYILILNAGWSKRQASGFIDDFLLRAERKLRELAEETSKLNVNDSPTQLVPYKGIAVAKQSVRISRAGCIDGRHK